MKKYGCLYSWKDAQKVCPKGWHLPTLADFTNLLRYAGDDYDRPNPAYFALTAKNSGLGNHAAKATNSTAFGALPAGAYYGKYNYLGLLAYFWSTMEHDKVNSYCLCLGDGYAGLQTKGKDNAYSVRCVKD